jgi:hypothetical protein
MEEWNLSTLLKFIGVGKLLSSMVNLFNFFCKSINVNTEIVHIFHIINMQEIN